METIDNIYDGVIKSKEWDYYNTNGYCISRFEDIFKGQDNAYDFIKRMIHESGKISAQNLCECLDKLKKEEPVTNRLRHVVSLFFLGFALYSKISVIKSYIDKQISGLGILNKEYSAERRFSFFWFLLCIYHDLGYAYENGLLNNNNSTDKELQMPEGFSPKLYTKENIDKYDKYRQCKWNVKDHGIWGGRVFYSEMLNIGKDIAKSHNSEIFETEEVERIYQYAAWLIMCHNINFDNGKSDYTNCYKCQGLNDFIIPKARCISLTNNPLLFLFCFADTIEPTKKLKSTNGDSTKDMEICKNLKMELSNDKIKFGIDDLQDYVVCDSYVNNLKLLKEWLIDINDNLEILFR